jgi:hypothetical protein
MFQLPPLDPFGPWPSDSSSASMDGEAAQEIERGWPKAKAQGTESKPSPNGPEYRIGRANGAKYKTSAEIRAARAARGMPAFSQPRAGSETSRQVPNGASATEAASNGDNQHFIIDTQPTPVNIRGFLNHPIKRPAEEAEEMETKSKKPKTKHDGVVPGKGSREVEIEFEDITEEVDARMRKREEKRMTRGEMKKRKRESEVSVAEPAQDATKSNDVEKPKRKKGKTGKGEVIPDAAGANDILGGEESGRALTVGSKRPMDAEGNGEGGKKKRKKLKRK